MHASIYSRAVDAARDSATRLGHKLGRFDVIRLAAYSACETCHSGVSVLFHSPPVTLGAAVELTCKSGEANAAPPAKPAPSTGKARGAPKPSPPAPVQDDGVPWFMRDKLPAVARG